MTTDPAPGPHAAGRGRWVAAGLVAFLLAALSAVATPLMGLPDEPAHAVHAAAVVRGQVAGRDEVRTDPTTGWTRTETHVEVPAAYAALPSLPGCFAFHASVPATCAPDVAATPGEEQAATTTVGTYDPAWYALVGWPSLVVGPAAGLLGMRVVAAAVFGALVAIAVAALDRAGARRWGLVAVALSVTPVAVHLGGGINPSGTEIAAGIALWATSAALLAGARERSDVVRWAVACVVMAVTRPLGPVIAVGIPVASLLVLRHDPPAPWDRPDLRGGAGIVSVVAVAALGWSVWRGTLSAFSGFPDPSATGLVAVRRSLGLVPERLVEMVGVLGWADVSLPKVLVGGWLLGVVALVAWGLRHADRRARAWLVVLGLVVLALPVLADVRSAPTIGFVWQGRYTLPIAVGLPLLAGVLLDRRRPVPAHLGGGAALALAAVGVGHVVALVAVLRRFRVGVDGTVGGALGAPGTVLGIEGWVVLGVTVVVALAPAALAWSEGQARPSSEVRARG